MLTLYLFDLASVNDCWIYTLKHKILSPRLMFLSSSEEHGIGRQYGADPMAVYNYLMETSDAIGWRLFGGLVDMGLLHEVSRSIGIGLLLIILPVFFSS